MKDIAISKFKATCFAALEEVRRTGAPVRITKFGHPIAEVVPSRPKNRGSWLGCAKESAEIRGDISGRIGAFNGWPQTSK